MVWVPRCFWNSKKGEICFYRNIGNNESGEDILKLIEATSEGQIKNWIADKTIIIKIKKEKASNLPQGNGLFQG